MNGLCDVKEAARFLSISPWTVRALIRQGKLHPVRIGRLVRLEGREIQSFIDAAKSNGSEIHKFDHEGARQ